MKTNNNSSNEEFYSIPLYVDSRVLIPRNDTEILVDNVLKELKNNKNQLLIDIGTGSCCIPIAIAKNSDIEKIYAIDISSDALEIAKINVKKYCLENKINLIKSDLLEYFLKSNYHLLTSKLIITANLPYIKNGDFKNMDQEVLDNEPHIALFGGEKTGFEMYEELIYQIFILKEKLNLEITLFIEIGFDQYDYSKNYLEGLGLKFEYFKDLNNIYRVIKIKI